MITVETVQPVLTTPFVLYQSPRLCTTAERLIHGFTGKGSPESDPAEALFTLGGLAYEPVRIRKNREQLCRHMLLNAERLSVPRQMHTDRIRINDTPVHDAADAVIVTEPGVAALILVADCVPIILYAPDQHVGAVVHAGWRGTAQAITQKTAQALIENHQAAPEKLIAAIGPAIGGCCYEVSEEVDEALAATVPDVPGARWKQLPISAGKPYVDLKQLNALQLEALDIQAIDILTPCTRCESERLFSHRRGESGRQGAFLQLC